ncbi:MAG: hypothetical protein A4E50_01402 [Methanosaeta sp. PtaB.Bin087]|nr:MAG: hypothetical protein A4E50_01402 [Methanosaeta sp. PtaB.Bin087]HOI68336.1 hypothetical protein [Methanothrix sp.]
MGNRLGGGEDGDGSERGRERGGGGKACPFVARACLLAGCMAWDGAGGCRLIPAGAEASGFDARLREAAPLLYGTLLDLVRVMEERAWECDACADLWDYAAEVRRSFLDEPVEAQLKVG